MLPEMKVYDHGLSPLQMQTPYSKSVLGIKSLFVIRFSKFLLHMLRQIKCQILLRKYFASLQIKYKVSAKFILKSQNNLFFFFLYIHVLLLTLTLSNNCPYYMYLHFRKIRTHKIIYRYKE